MAAGYTATKTERAYVRDFLLFELEARYNRIAATLTNDSASPIDFQPGEILQFDTDHYEPTKLANLGDAILISDVGELAAAASKEVAVLIRGPAIVNEDALTVQAAATFATVLTDLKSNLPDVVFIKEPTIKQVGPLE